MLLKIFIISSYIYSCIGFIRFRSNSINFRVKSNNWKTLLQYNNIENDNIFDPIYSKSIKDQNPIFPISSQTSARISLLAVSALYGSNFGCVKILDQALEPSLAAACRFFLAGLVFLPYFINHVSKGFSPLLIGGIEVGTYCFIGYWAQAQALLTSNASTVAFICSLAVIVVPILDLFFQIEKKDYFQTIFPAILAAFGVACLEFGGHSVPGLGDLWACIQPIFFGLSFWRVEKHISKTKEVGDVQAFTGAMLLTVALFSCIWVLHDFIEPLMSTNSNILASLGNQFQSFNDWRVTAAILWTGVVTTALTSFVENFAMKNLSASESTIIYSTEPLWGTAFAAVTLNESIGWNTVLGAILILAACVWSSVGPVIGTGLLSSSFSSFSEKMVEIHETTIKNVIEFYENSQIYSPEP